MGKIKEKQFLIGFALETENEVENAKLKIQKKNLDLIVLNSLQDKGAGFGNPTNKITFIIDSIREMSCQWPMPVEADTAIIRGMLRDKTRQASSLSLNKL